MGRPHTQQEMVLFLQLENIKVTKCVIIVSFRVSIEDIYPRVHDPYTSYILLFFLNNKIKFSHRYNIIRSTSLSILLIRDKNKNEFLNDPDLDVQISFYC